MGTVITMKTAIILVLGLASLVYGQREFIVGGYEADIADHPWQGSYRIFGSHSCGCVLVSAEWVVTAAHCGGGSSYTVSFGATDRTKGTVGEIESVTAHPSSGVGLGAYPNDISVVKLTSSVSGQNIEPIAMGRNRLNGGEVAIISGWGRTCGFCGIPLTLRAAQLDILSDSECTAIWGGNYNGDAHVCVHDKINKSKGACNGDSGGPMTSGGMLHGVTSWGATGCSTNYASSYTRVSSYVGWVCEVTGNAAQGC